MKKYDLSTTLGSLLLPLAINHHLHITLEKVRDPIHPYSGQPKLKLLPTKSTSNYSTHHHHHRLSLCISFESASQLLQLRTSRRTLLPLTNFRANFPLFEISRLVFKIRLRNVRNFIHFDEKIKADQHFD